MTVEQGKVRCNAKSLICFWLSCGVFLLSAWKNVGMNRTKMLSFGIGIHEELEERRGGGGGGCKHPRG